MKNYPYIFSLSTIGLIHHYNSDYLFNRTRTDFTGDGGTGKSMIADILQLIFVGSSAFDSASDPLNDGPRTPGGMVLVNQAKGYSGKGYAFLNVAVAEREYFVIGAYIEGTTNQYKPFLIHSGFDTEQLTPNQRPILHHELLKDGQILPVEDLIAHLSEFDLTCETFGITTFHKVLSEQKIIPFDLVNDPKKLKSYALIIRSFSRGKGFKFNSKGLQDFLFGDDKEKKITKKYETGLKSISDSYSESSGYLEQINRLEKKRDGIKNLIDLHRRKQSAQIKLLHAKRAFHNKAVETLSANLNDCEKKLGRTFIESNLLNEKVVVLHTNTIEQDIRKAVNRARAKENEKKDKQQEKDKKASYDKWNPKFQGIEKVQGLLTKNDWSVEDLKEQYTRFRTVKKEKAQLAEFKSLLTIGEIIEPFEETNWSGSVSDKMLQIDQKIREAQDEIANLKAILKFSRTDHTDSLAFWAIQHEAALSEDAESALLKLQDLLVSEPEDIEKRYLPRPEELLNSLSIHSRSDGGFWLDIGGVLEFIPIVERQFLDTESKEEKEAYFSNQFERASIGIKEYKENLRFYETLKQIPGLFTYLDLYERRIEIASETFNLETLPQDQQAFEDLLQDYGDRDKITQIFREAESAWRKAVEKVVTNQSALSESTTVLNPQSLKEKKTRLQSSLLWFPQHRKRISDFFQVDGLQLDTISSGLEELLSETDTSQLLSQKTGQLGSLKQKRKALITGIESANILLKEIREECDANSIQLEPQEANGQTPSETELNKLTQAFSDLTDEYRLACRALVETYLTNDKHRYWEEENWQKLARAILPKVFSNPDISESELDSEVGDRLQKIIDANTVISDRKIKTLLDIVDEVEEAVNDFITEVNHLRGFFDRNDTRITGGHKAVLKQTPSSDYPIVWIDKFKKLIKSEASKSPGGLFEVANQSIHFQDLMIRAFKACGGKKQNPKIQELLNPKNYFSLRFNLIRNNMTSKGSNSQVYSATALLCIARMSLIEKGASKKQREGIRFMPIDEAEGLGSNYEMLAEIAKSMDYQVISMSINPVGEFEEGNQFTYMLHEPEDEELRINGDAFAQFKEDGLTENLQDYVYEYVRYEG